MKFFSPAGGHISNVHHRIFVGASAHSLDARRQTGFQETTPKAASVFHFHPFLLRLMAKNGSQGIVQGLFVGRFWLLGAHSVNE